MKIATIDGPPADIANGAIGDLRARLRGRLLIDGDPDYDRARVVFNGLFHRRIRRSTRMRSWTVLRQLGRQSTVAM